jgi:hypothetical protein
MPSNPNEIWQQLSKDQQQDTLTQLALICKEIIDDIGTRHNATPCQQSHHLRTAIDTPSDAEQPRKFGITICTQAESYRIGLAT